MWLRRWLFSFVVAFPLQCEAGAFKVFPLSLQFDQGTKTASLKISNVDESPVRIQLEGMIWQQDEVTGADTYGETKDILFFPKIVTVERGSERVVRVGYKGSFPSGGEKTYRLFMQELPAPTPSGAALNFLLRLSIPLFVVSGGLDARPVLEKTTLSNGAIYLTVRNSGTTHALVNLMEARGVGVNNEEVFRREGRGWYVLPGVSRTFRVGLQDAPCDQAKRIAIRAEVGAVVLSGTLPVRALDCVAPQKVDAAGKKK